MIFNHDQPACFGCQVRSRKASQILFFLSFSFLFSHMISWFFFLNVFYWFAIKGLWRFLTMWHDMQCIGIKQHRRHVKYKIYFELVIFISFEMRVNFSKIFFFNLVPKICYFCFYIQDMMSALQLGLLQIVRFHLLVTSEYIFWLLFRGLF